MKSFASILLIVGLACSAAATASAELSLSPFIREGMVLQRGGAILTGKAAPRQWVTIEFRGDTKKGKRGRADKNGFWAIEVRENDASHAPEVLSIYADDTLCYQFTNILVGDVWLVGVSERGVPVVAVGDPVSIRVLRLQDGAPDRTGWETGAHVAAPELSFDALAWSVGEELARNAKVPIGIIQVPAQTLRDQLKNPHRVPEVDPRTRSEIAARRIVEEAIIHQRDELIRLKRLGVITNATSIKLYGERVRIHSREAFDKSSFWQMQFQGALWPE